MPSRKKNELIKKETSVSDNEEPIKKVVEEESVKEESKKKNPIKEDILVKKESKKKIPIKEDILVEEESVKKESKKKIPIKEDILVEEESVKKESKKKIPIKEDILVEEESVKKKIPSKEESVKKKLSKNSTLSSIKDSTLTEKSNDNNESINLSLNNTKKALLILLEEVRVLELKLEDKNEEVKIIYKNFKELLEKIQIPDNIKSKNNELKVLSDSDNVESD